MFTDRRRRRIAGISLIELVFFIVIVGVGVAGVLSVLNVTVKSSADPQRRKQALAIAEALLEEVELSGMTYCDIADPNVYQAQSVAECTTMPEGPGAENGNSRPYDNVNDYADAYNTPKSLTGDVNSAIALIPSGYRATVTIVPESLNDIVSNETNPRVLRIAVTVSYGSDSIVLEGYRTRYAPRTPNES